MSFQQWMPCLTPVHTMFCTKFMNVLQNIIQIFVYSTSGTVQFIRCLSIKFCTADDDFTPYYLKLLQDEKNEQRYCRFKMKIKFFNVL